MRDRSRQAAETLSGSSWRGPALAAYVALAGVLVAWLVVGASLGPSLDYREGDRVRSEVVAPVRLSVLDPNRTEALRTEFAARVPPVFDFDPRAQGRTVEQVVAALVRMRNAFETAAQGSTPPDPASFAAEYQAEFPYGGEAVLAVFARNGFDARLVEGVGRALERRLSGYVVTDDLPASPQVTVRDLSSGVVYPVPFRDLTRLSDVKAAFRQDVLAIEGLATSDKVALADGLEPLMSATLVPNPTRTEAARNETRAAVSEVRDDYPAGEIVAYRNQVVDARIARALAAVEAARSAPNVLARWVGITLLSWVLLYALWYAAAHAAPHALGPRRAFLLATLLLVFQVALLRLGVEVSSRLGTLADASFHTEPQYMLAAPLAVAPLTTALLAGGALGLVGGLVLLPLVALMTAGSPGGGIAMAVFAALVSIAAVRRASGYHTRLVVAGAALHLAAGGALGLAAALLIAGAAPSAVPLLMTNLGLAALGAVLSASLTAILLPFLELAFGIVSDVRLLELANTDRPVLRELAIRAPGTHQHSYVMSSVATEAAKAIGANVLLVRIGAYYHDIGKLHAPEMFVENQGGGPNPHDDLTPEESARQIIRHVAWGVERARKDGLPEQVCELITGHHGTRTLHFFLEKARRSAPPGTEVDESLFRYPGPKPQTRESAILMLADGAEAAVRSLDEPTREAVDAIVGKIADTVLADHQLDECDMTLAEVVKVRAAIVEALLNLHHRRIKYPGFNAPVEAREPSPVAARE